VSRSAQRRTKLHPASYAGDLTQAHFAGIGRVAVEWTILEDLIHRYYSELLRFPHAQGRKRAAEIGKVSVLLAQMNTELAKSSSPGECRAFRTLKSAILQCARERDRIVHSVWFRLSKPPYAEAWRTTHRRGFSAKRYTPQSLDAWVERIHKTIDGLVHFMVLYRQKRELAYPLDNP